MWSNVSSSYDVLRNAGAGRFSAMSDKLTTAFNVEGFTRRLWTSVKQSSSLNRYEVRVRQVQLLVKMPGGL